MAALLVRAADQKATGTLRLTRGKVRKVIFTLDGTPVFVDSNLRNETLGAYLVAQGKLDETQLARAMREARSRKKKLGEALVSLGLTDKQTVEAGLRAQTGIKIISALRWGDGSFHYTPGHDFKGKVPNCPVDVVPMVLSALARFSDGEELRARVAALLDHGVRLTTLGRSHIESIMRVFGHDLLAGDTDRLPLRQLMDRSPDGAALLVQVEVLRRAGLAELATLAAAETRPQPQPTSGSVAPSGAPSGAMPRLAGSSVAPLPGPPSADDAAGSGPMPQVAGGLPPMPPPPAASGSQVQRIAELPPGQAPCPGEPRVGRSPTFQSRKDAGGDGSRWKPDHRTRVGGPNGRSATGGARAARPRAHQQRGVARSRDRVGDGAAGSGTKLGGPRRGCLGDPIYRGARARGTTDDLSLALFDRDAAAGG